MLNRCHLLEFSAIWPYRLSVRSSGFHPGKSGSIPGGATEQVQMYLDKESFSGPKDWGVPGRLLQYWIMV